jgi:hypothetical protein
MTTHTLKGEDIGLPEGSVVHYALPDHESLPESGEIGVVVKDGKITHAVSASPEIKVYDDEPADQPIAKLDTPKGNAYIYPEDKPLRLDWVVDAMLKRRGRYQDGAATVEGDREKAQYFSEGLRSGDPDHPALRASLDHADPDKAVEKLLRHVGMTPEEREDASAMEDAQLLAANLPLELLKPLHRLGRGGMPGMGGGPG